MSVIAFVGNKGGAGKTTLSINFAVGLSKEADVGLVDADPQGSALQWSKISETPSSLSVYEDKPPIDQRVSDLNRQHDHLVIDCPPYLQSPQTAAVLQFADIALVPVMPSPMDIWATVHVEKAVEAARKVNPDIQVFLVVNQLEIRTTFSRVMREALSEINFSVMDSDVRRRAVYRNSVLEGKSVFEMGSVGKNAVEEVNNLIKEVMSR